MKTFVSCLLLAGIFGCDRPNVAANCTEKPNSGIACTYQYEPVCGCNGKTFGNACAASAVGIRIVSEGECPSGSR